jgi:hypothetical protein
LAYISDRVLVVPDRYFYANLSATALPWERCAKAQQLPPSAHSGRVMLRARAEWAISQCDKASHRKVKLTRCRRGGCAGVPAGISNCSQGGGRNPAGTLDRCVVLNGLVRLNAVLAAVPEFTDPAASCVTVTHLARGVLVAPAEGGACAATRWHPLMFANEWVARADSWLAAQKMRTQGNETKASYIAAQFRTEKVGCVFSGLCSLSWRCDNFICCPRDV